MNILLGLICVASVAFLLRFLVALRVECRRPRGGTVTVCMTSQPSAAMREAIRRQRGKTALVMTFPSIATRSTGQRAMRIVVAVIAISLCVLPLHAQDASSSNPASTDEVRELRTVVQEFQAKVERLEKNAAQDTPGSGAGTFL